MKSTISKQEKKIVTRLKRVEGQLRGIVKMIENDEPINKVGVQLKAALSGLESADDAFKRMLIIEQVYEGMEKALEEIKN